MSQAQAHFTEKSPLQHPAAADETVPKRKIHKRMMNSPELVYGQSLIVITRWILVVMGLFLVLWNPDPLGSLRVQVMTIIMLALMNFYLQAQLLMGRKMIASVVYAASVVDFLIITLLIMLSGGFDSNTYVFYFPAIMAISVAFSREMTAGFVGSAATAYLLLSLGSGAASSDTLPVLIARILMMAGIAFCGNLYLHIEQARRLEAGNAHKKLAAEVQQTQLHDITYMEEETHADES